MTISATYFAEEAKRRKRDGFLHCQIVREAIEATAKAHDITISEAKKILLDEFVPELGG